MLFVKGTDEAVGVVASLGGFCLDEAKVKGSQNEDSGPKEV